jgi:hypothetical protein
MPTRAIGAQHQWGSVEQASETPWSAPSTAAAMAGQEPYGRQTPREAPETLLANLQEGSLVPAMVVIQVASEGREELK